jgi:hypothetical protein
VIDLTISVGDWVIVSYNDRKYKGYVLQRNPNVTRVNIYVPELKDFSPHVYFNSVVKVLPLDTFENSNEMYIDAALLLGCRDTFMEITNKENRSV